MDDDAEGADARFSDYVEGLVSVIGHADRAGPLRDYCAGLLLPGERKSVEPLAARTAPERTAAQHQSLLHFVGQGGWSDEKVLTKDRVPPLAAKRPAFPQVVDPAVPPLRTERHIPDSIATMRRPLTVEIARRLPRCPCCAKPLPARRSRNL